MQRNTPKNLQRKGHLIEKHDVMELTIEQEWDYNIKLKYIVRINIVQIHQFKPIIVHAIRLLRP